MFLFQIKNELRTLIKKAEISKIEIIMKKRLRVKKFMDKLKTSRKCLIGLFATLPITNHQHSVAQYKMLSSVVKTMNTLMPMVYHMGSTEFKKATLKLFLIFDNKTIGRCELEESLVLVTFYTILFSTINQYLMFPPGCSTNSCFRVCRTQRKISFGNRNRSP